MTKKNKTRREFLGAAGVVATGALAAGAHANTTPAVNKNGEPPAGFQPKEYWEDRMQAPDDGKKYGWFIDTRRCFGCHGCEVSCKSENDVPLGNYIRQTFFKDVGEYPKVARMFLPMACQHCEDAPSILTRQQTKRLSATIAITESTREWSQPVLRLAQPTRFTLVI
jgi:ferredoxin